MKKIFQSLSIRNKLTLLMVSISVVTLSGSAFLFYQNQIEILESAAVESAKTQASLIGASIESAVIFGDERTAEKMLNLLKSDSDVELAAVILPDKTIFASFNMPGNTLLPDVNLNVSINLGADYLDTVERVISQGEVISYIFTRTNLSKLKDQRKYYGSIFIAVLLVSILLAYIMSRYVQGIFTSPLEVMARYAEGFGTSSNYERRLEMDRDDELGILLDGFNNMLDVVQERELELKSHGSKLQELVDVRTKQLYQKAHYDSLTELPNRYLLMDRLNHAINSARRREKKLALLFLDLDRFKVINDSLGHLVGDQLLKSVANRLSNSGRDVDTLARLGGDEFVFLLEEIRDEKDVALVAQRIIKILREPIQIEKHVLHITTSIGISIYPGDGLDSQSLLKNADISMYASKQKGPGQYSFYKDEMNRSSFERLEMENLLRESIENDEFFLLYQPQVCTKTNSVKGVEALIRWNSPQLGHVSPSDFIPIAEEIGIINRIGEWVIAEVCRQIMEWKSEGLDYIRVAVNISASHLLDTGIVDCITKQVSRYNLEYSQIELEITEDVFLEHSHRTIQILENLQKLGVRIAIDDFGTGYSSLQYLQKLPLNTLKLDGMFIKDIENNMVSQGIVSSTITLAHSLNLVMVAECVETEKQVDYLRQQNCDLVQGYYYFKPLRPDEIVKIYK